MSSLSKTQRNALSLMADQNGRLEWGQGFTLNTMFALQSRGLVAVHFGRSAGIWNATLTEKGKAPR